MAEKYRVAWFPQVPCKPFHVPVRTLREAKFIMLTLANYDLFQFQHHIKPDYSHAGVLQVFDSEDTEDGPEGSWVDWHGENDDGCELDDPSELDDALIEKLDRAEAEREPPCPASS